MEAEAASDGLGSIPSVWHVHDMHTCASLRCVQAYVLWALHAEDAGAQRAGLRLVMHVVLHANCSCYLCAVVHMQTLLAVPLVGLYMGGAFAVKAIEARRAAAAS